MRSTYDSDEISIKKKIWLRKIYAAAAQNFALSEAQAEVACDICNQAGLDLTSTFVDDDFMKYSRGANEMV